MLTTGKLSAAKMAAMFGPRLSTVFVSRWKALWWAASILVLTWSVVPAADQNGEASGPSKPAHVDPWAKDQPQKGGATSP
ncbi:MAG: hypothetical protein ACOVQ0_14700 [Novosphingobium sp.]|uniref:hypothetical protein n=1 Tax=Novosphingobium sp. TaxID=1874826 RepID=UPI003B9B5503